MTLDLEKIRTGLELERTRLTAALRAVDHPASLEEESGELSAGADDHLADSATDTYLRQLDGGLEENAEQLLEQVEQALLRLREGTYGTCTVCGEAIPEERLEAVPYASLCIEHKRALEST